MIKKIALNVKKKLEYLDLIVNVIKYIAKIVESPKNIIVISTLRFNNKSY